MNRSRLADAQSAAKARTMRPARRATTEQAYVFALPLIFLILALLLFPGPLAPLGMIGMLGVCALRWIARGSPVPLQKINLLLLILLSFFAFGLLQTPAPELAWMRTSHLLAGVLVLFTIADRAENRAQVTATAGVLVLVAALFAFGAPFATAWSGAQGFDFGELTSRYVPLLARPSNVNSVAGVLEAAVPLAFALIAARQQPWRVVGAVALAPLLIVLLLLQSRGAWLAVATGMVVYAALYRRWVLPLVPLVLLAGLWLNAALGEPLPAQALGADSRSVVTVDDRIEIWTEAAQLLSTAPLSGIGVNGFAARGAPLIGQVPSQYRLSGSHAHNLFLEIALDTGVIGLAAFAGIVGMASLAAWRVYRCQGAGSPERALAIGLLAAFAVLITHGMFDLIFWGFKGGIFLWATIALSLALERNARHDSVSP